MKFKTTKIKIEKRAFTYEGIDYNLYLIPEKSNGDDILSFYINKEGYGDLHHVFGIKDFLLYDIEEMIINNIEHFVNLVKDEI